MTEANALWDSPFIQQQVPVPHCVQAPLMSGGGSTGSSGSGITGMEPKVEAFQLHPWEHPQCSSQLRVPGLRLSIPSA